MNSTKRSSVKEEVQQPERESQQQAAPERVAHYCPIVEHRRFVDVCNNFVALRKAKKQLPEGNFQCSAAINGKRCPVYKDTTPVKQKRKRKCRKD